MVSEPPRGAVSDSDDPAVDADLALASGRSETPWRQLHPLSVVVNLVPQAWRTVRGAWPLLLVLVVPGAAGGGVELFDLSLLLLFFVMALGRTVVHFATLRYRIHAGRFEVRFGLINRQARELDPVRIQNISLERNLFHRASGLVEVRVETAGDGGTHGLLSALSIDAATELQEQIQALVRNARGAAPALLNDDTQETEEAERDAPLVSANLVELVAFGLSKRTVGTVAVLTAVGFELLSRMGPQGAEQLVWLQSEPSVLVAAFLLAFAGSWVWSAVTSVVRHWRFTLRRQGDRLVSTEGLTTTRRVEIPVGKVQVVQIAEPWLRRAMGYASVLVETAALGFADGRVRQAEGVLPMVPGDALGTVLAALVPGRSEAALDAPLLPAAPRALWQSIVGRLLRYAILAGLFVALTRGVSWGWAAFTAVPLAVPFGYLDWRWQGWLVTDGAIVMRRGFFRRRTWVVARDKIQSVHVGQTLFMRWHRLGRVEVRVAGSAVPLPDLRLEDAHRIYDSLLLRGRPLDTRTFKPIEAIPAR